MAVPLTEDQFTEILAENIRPAQPIDSPELLRGRQQILRDIDRALRSPGMHAFIHGERGVGKTSLALTAAKSISKTEPAYIGCDDHSSFEGIVDDMCDALLGKRFLARDTKVDGGGGLSAFGAKFEVKVSGTHQIVRSGGTASINQAADVIGECVEKSGASVVIVDELDRIKAPEVKSQIAELIKRIHDKRINIKLVMCGIGKTLDEIIGSHLSASRAIAPFELGPISFDARWEIVNKAADKLGFSVPREFVIRMSQISDGFPYYVHLIAENLFWQIFDHRNVGVAATSSDFHAAVNQAIQRAEAPLREKYNFAIQKTKNSSDYEEALWSLAEGTHFERQIQDVYSKSYLPIFQRRYVKNPDKAHLKIEQFRTRLYSLCKDSHGRIVTRKRNSWYAFDENVIRGYVRMVAQRAGVELGVDHFSGSD